MRARSAAEIPVVTPSAASIDREVGAVRRAVVADHQRQVELAAARLDSVRQISPARICHEVDGFRGDVFGRQHQVAFVFAVFLVSENDHLAGLMSAMIS